MARSYGSVRPVAIALVVEEEDGSLTTWRSKSLRAAELAMQSGYIHNSYRVEAECRDLVMQRTVRAPYPVQIEQRGIYLPDMSFRALPPPEDM